MPLESRYRPNFGAFVQNLANLAESPSNALKQEV
jgi:hypothetical protein